ncbi:TolC family protein [Limnoglobus roseus]|uniref:TolC family protein n=1 Tax=Limnoglobus roseus TaxID=2598579 RepID=A0A5C1ARV5_9BACT|nr:TolC family protein [Limnoglobus roseus]QEL19608.1 TolC family protein [Limnoglobus roseus]
MVRTSFPRWCVRWFGVGCVGLLVAGHAFGQQPPRVNAQQSIPDAPPGTILQPGECPIDLGSALSLAGVENPQLLLARQRVLEATAVRQLAAAQLLPNVNVGTNYDLHRGVLQQSAGTILPVNRDAAYVGLGANSVGGGTVSVPGLNYNLNVGSAWYGYLATRQRQVTAGAAADAVRNDVLLRVCLAYLDLVRAEQRRAIAIQNRTDAAEIARLTDVYAKGGQGKKSDADRAAVELRRRDAETAQTEADMLTASARLCGLLNLDPTTRLKAVEGWAVPTPLVPATMTLPDLLATALLQRPELAARRSDIRQSLYELSLAKVLPFSPNVVLGFSAGGFGGGSNLIAAAGTGPRFGDFDTRTDLDVAVFWTFRNLGVGNLALARAADSRMKQSRLRELETLNVVRGEVAEAHARSAARLVQIDAAEKAVRASAEAYREDLTRIRGGQGLPLEVVDSLRLLNRSQTEYLDAIVDYNRAQFQLWVALGRPPADCLTRPVEAHVGPRVVALPSAVHQLSAAKP